MKVLVTGAAGSIGLQVIKFLLAEGKYEITALDLKNKNTMQSLKNYRKRINIIYSDVNEQVLIDALVKEHDYVIHLSSAMPPLSDMKKGLSNAIDYAGTETIIKAINYYNPKCHLFMASTTSLYGNNPNQTVKSRINTNEIGYFAKSKYDAERLIKEKINNWTIYRIPMVLNHPTKDRFMYHGLKNSMIDVITKEDAALAFVQGIKHSKELNKKTFNLADTSINYGKLLDNIIYLYGTNVKYIMSRLFLEHNFYSPVTNDHDELNDIINYRNDSLEEYLSRVRNYGKKRKIARWLVRGKKKKMESDNNG